MFLFHPPNHREQDSTDVVQAAREILGAHCTWKWKLLQEADARVTHGALQRAIWEYHQEGEDEWTDRR